MGNNHKDNHKVDKIIDIICILISIPGSIVGPFIWGTKFAGLLFNFIFGEDHVDLLVTDFKFGVMIWPYIIALIALVISTFTVRTIWKMFRAGGKGFVACMHAPVFLWIITFGSYIVIPIIVLFTPFIAGCIVPVVPILICVINKHKEWKQEQLDTF